MIKAHTYLVKWQTRIGPGSAFYSGQRTIEADTPEEAQDRVQWLIWHNAFRDYFRWHIQITSVTEQK